MNTSRDQNWKAIEMANEDIFFSRTDERGVIQSGSDFFQEIAGFEWEELLGAPHKVVRHPDMPKAVFWLLWNNLKAGKPLSAYIKNQTKDGGYYWVMASAMPVDGGYISVRIRPQSPLFAKVQAEYEALRAWERETGAKAEESVERFQRRLTELGFKDYQTFMGYALSAEHTARQEALGRETDRVTRLIEDMSSRVSETSAVTNQLLAGFRLIRSEPTNMRILSTRLEGGGNAISAISQNYELMASEIWQQIHVLDESGGNVFGEVAKALNEGRYLQSLAAVMREQADQFANSSLDFAALGIDQSKEPEIIEGRAAALCEEADRTLQNIADRVRNLPDLCQNLRRHVNGLDVVKLLCRVEAGTLRGQETGLDSIIGRLDRFHAQIENQLTQVSSGASDLYRDARALLI